MAEQTDLPFRNRLVAFFNHYDMDRIEEVDSILQENKGKEAKLFKQLVGRYGAEVPSMKISNSMNNLTIDSDVFKSPPKPKLSTPTRKQSLITTAKGVFFNSSPATTNTKKDEDDISTQKTSFMHCSSGLMKNGLVIKPGSVHGWLFRHWDTLHKIKLLYYVIDFQEKQLVEYDGDNGKSQPRNVFSFQSARLSVDSEVIKATDINLFSCSIFFRSEIEGKPKICKLSSEDNSIQLSWLGSIRKVIASSNVENLKADSDENAVAIKTNNPTDATTTVVKTEANEPSTDEKDSLTTTVVIKGDKYQILCSKSSTNAWLLSEAIRMFLAQNDDRDPGIQSLFNTSSGKELDLSDDVFDCINNNDVLEARCETIHHRRKSDNDLIETGTAPPIVPSNLTPSSPRHKNKQPVSNVPISNVVETSSTTSTGRSTNKAATSTIQRWFRRHRSSTFDDEQLSESDETTGRDDDDDERMPTRLKFIPCQSYNMKMLEEDGVPEHLCNMMLNLLNATTHPTVPYWLPNKWIMKSIQNNVRFYKSKKTTGVLAQTTINASCNSVFECILDYNKAFEYNPYYKNGCILEFSQHNDVIYMEFDGLQPFPSLPIKSFDRYFCVNRFWHKFEDDTYVVLLSPNKNHPLCPKKSNLLTNCDEFFGGYVIRPMEYASLSYSSSPSIVDSTATIHEQAVSVEVTDRCVVTYLCDYKFNGWVAGMLGKANCEKLLASTLAGIRETVVC